MMNISSSKLNQFNKSYSETDLRLWSNFNNSTVNYTIPNEDEIIKRTVFIEEIIRSNSPVVLKRYTSDQSLGYNISDSTGLESRFAEKVILTDVFDHRDTQNISFNTVSNSNIVCNDRKNIINDVIPMDIDDVQEMKTENHIDFRTIKNINTEDCTNKMLNTSDKTFRKRKHFRNISAIKEDSSDLKFKTELLYITSHKKRYDIVIVIGLSLLTVLSLIYLMTFISINNEVQIELIKKDMKENVLEQQIAVNAVVQSLEEREHWASKNKVLAFIGSNGVGKTFVANIIKKHFHPGLVREIYGFQLPYKKVWKEKLESLNSCCLNLIIVDDLKRHNIADLFSLIYSLPQNQFILILPIFNIQYTEDKITYIINSTDVMEIHKDFDNSGIYHEAIVFDHFNTTHLKSWLQMQLNVYNIDFTLNAKILKSILDIHDVKYSGLKGVYPKLLLELEKYK